MSNNNAVVNARISAAIIEATKRGLDTPAAYDSVMGAGAYRRMTDDIWERLQNVRGRDGYRLEKVNKCGD